MLQILCSYVEHETDPLEQLWSLFEGKLQQYTFDAIKSVEWNPSGGIPLAGQVYMLEHINQLQSALQKERWIFSESIESIKFDDCVTITCTVSALKFFISFSLIFMGCLEIHTNVGVSVSIRQ